MPRKMKREDLVNIVISMRKSKENMVKNAMLLDVDKDYKEIVGSIKLQIKNINKTIEYIDDKIIELDNA
jgi:hypothetical protein